MAAIITQLQCFILLVLCHRSTSDGDCFNSCDVSKNYLILFDEYQSRDELRATQVYVSKLARMLRSEFEDTRVAVGTFNGIKSSIRDSDHRKSHAFEQVILDLDINPSSKCHLGTALSLIESSVKDSNKFLAVLLIMASKGKDDAENTEFETKAKALSQTGSNLALYALGIGENIHEGTFNSFSSSPTSGRGWKVGAVSKIENVEIRILSKLLCDPKISITTTSNSSTQVTTPTLPPTEQEKGNGTITIYSKTDFRGEEKTIKLNPGGCINLKKSLGAAVKSIKNHKTCIAIHDDNTCRGAQKTIFDKQSGLSVVPNSAYNTPYDYASLCATESDDHLFHHILLYLAEEYRGLSARIDVNSDGSCVNLSTYEKKFESIDARYNCVVLYDTINCVLTTSAQRIAHKIPKLKHLELENTVQSIDFCNN